MSYRYRDSDVEVHISASGLRRYRHDNELLRVANIRPIGRAELFAAIFVGATTGVLWFWALSVGVLRVG